MLRRLWEPTPDHDLSAAASAAKYIGSPEHKDIKSFAGQPKPRADASICDRSLAEDQERVRGWLEKALRRKVVSARWEGCFPRYVWYKEGGTVYEGRLVNSVQGWYKGYPLNPEEWPSWIGSVYD